MRRKGGKDGKDERGSNERRRSGRVQACDYSVMFIGVVQLGPRMAF